MAMTWTTFHHRGDVLRTVIRAADARRDGVLPMDVIGVRETFGDELTLLGALQLRWHTRLSGHLERALLDGPTDPEQAAIEAWHATADDLPGTRLVLDHHRAEPLDEEMASAVAISAAKEQILIAAMAGRAGARTEDTIATGLELEERARRTHRPAATRPAPRGLLGRIKARVAA
jgi:hypothetical protein